MPSKQKKHAQTKGKDIMPMALLGSITEYQIVRWCVHISCKLITSHRLTITISLGVDCPIVSNLG
jgi:hypothetical protein